MTRFLKSKFFVSFLLASLLVVSAGTCSWAAIKTFYSDVGIDSNSSLFPYSCDSNALLNGNAVDITPPEGFTSVKSTSTATTAVCGYPGYAGWAVCYSTSSPQNFSSYETSGEMRLWVRSSTNSVKIEASYLNGPVGSGVEVTTQVVTSLPNWNAGADINQWKLYRFSLANMQNVQGVDFTRVVCPLKITAVNLVAPTTFYTDFVRWTSSSTISMVNITLKNISNNAVASTITWNSGANNNPPPGWALANQYIQVDLDPDAASWGLQIYTDNKAADASPKYTGSSDPAGLVDSTDTTKALPMAWSVTDTTTTVPNGFVAPVPPANNPNGGDPNSFQWLFMKDRGTSGFTDGFVSNPYSTVVDNTGIHHASGDTQFGAANSPHRIYLEANFATAVTPRTYRTTTLRLEFYHD
jgi:hypothetical protein